MLRLGLLCMFIYSVTSQVIITSPESLRAKFQGREISASFSNFGKLPYGFTTYGKVYLDPIQPDKDYACKPLKTIKIGDSSSYDSAIILVDRGGCSFVKKVQNVQDIGGQIALIVNNELGNPEDILMMDDGNGKNLKIPGVLISQNDGEIIKNHYIENKNTKEADIRLSISFNMVKRKGKTNIKLYMQSDSIDVYQLLSHFEKFEEELGNSITLTSNYVTFPLTYFNFDTPVENCYAAGIYCADPNPLLNIKDGRAIIEENIRQVCLYKYTHKNKKSHLYVKFMASFYRICMDRLSPNFTSECHFDVLNTIGIDTKVVLDCYNESFINSGEYKDKSIYVVENHILRSEFEDKKVSELALFPAITVNGQIFLGSWNSKTFLRWYVQDFLRKYQKFAIKKKFLKL